MSFLDDLQKTRESALGVIRMIIEKRGRDFDLINPSAYSSELLDDEVYELPRATYIGKYDVADEFAIIAVDITKKNELIFNGLGLFETEESRDFSVEELSTGTICGVADIMVKIGWVKPSKKKLKK